MGAVKQAMLEEMDREQARDNRRLIRSYRIRHKVRTLSDDEVLGLAENERDFYEAMDKD